MGSLKPAPPGVGLRNFRIIPASRNVGAGSYDWFVTLGSVNLAPQYTLGVMEKAFKHPLARRATTATVRHREGGEQSILFIVTTLELDPAEKRFNQKNVNRLHNAAQAFLAEAKEISGYAFVNRPKDWDA